MIRRRERRSPKSNSRRALSIESLERRQLLAGVQLLKDVNATPYDGDVGGLVQVGTNAYFTATTATGKLALWKSDGTAAGSKLVKEFADNLHEPQSMTAVGSKLFFTYFDEASGYELWKSDG